ncbi:outer membrane protein assembly factor BamE [Alkalicaulis satelles]|uniref:Outer membrane protein assembly factor BamE n=1 Tax=Alkalicaulis satelles TaxID=2609175 RepID=A0A5M6ZIT0_9PROT|nr:outer membrane protein assembly factor BamE [Alkalicaulis satelles]KAA5804726.1 outer membrane protein assembly factor BamE [Alkalicaulis satelles]
MAFRRALIASAIVLAAGLVSACNPTLRSHGFRFPDGEVPVINVGEDNQASILANLGSPSTRGMFDDDVWYYIADTREYLAYLRPETRERRVIAVRFDADGVVKGVEEYGLEDGRIVAVVGRETPTRGRELSVLEQLLGNVGRPSVDQFDGQQNLPGGAGGPRRR